MSHEELVCPRCGAARVPGRHCPNCGFGGPEPARYLLETASNDRCVAILGALLPLVLFIGGGSLAPGPIGLVGIVLLAVEVSAVFTVLVPYRTVRHAFAVTVSAYTFPVVLLTGCIALLRSPSFMGSQVLPGGHSFEYGAAAGALFLFQAVLLVAAFWRSR